MSEYERPGLLRWLTYAFGRKLPERFHPWVLHDITCRTWVLRHILRGLVQISVGAALVLLLLPAPMPLRVLTTFTAAGPCLLGYTINIIAMTEHRLIKAGYRPAIAAKIRSRRAVDAQTTANRARRERIAERLDARAARRGR
jgi:hypothetical protein